MRKKPKPQRKRGDPAILDRLNRAMGAYLLETGKRVEWQALAKAAGLGLSTMTDITTLDRKVTIADAIAFADYLGVSFAWLAAGRGPMRATPPLDAVRDARRVVETTVQHLGKPLPRRRGRSA